MLIAKLHYWLVRRICRRYARDYLRGVDRMGLAWIFTLIDEDVALHGHAFNHALARAGVIDYSDFKGVSRGAFTRMADCPGARPVAIERASVL